jgi:hypothetical protein
MTFFTNVSEARKQAAPAIACALAVFGTGAFVAALMFITSYLAQLCYGNGSRKAAVTCHNITYLLAAFSLLAFCYGIYSARSAMLHVY